MYPCSFVGRDPEFRALFALVRPMAFTHSTISPKARAAPEGILIHRTSIRPSPSPLGLQSAESGDRERHRGTPSLAACPLPTCSSRYRADPSFQSTRGVYLFPSCPRPDRSTQVTVHCSSLGIGAGAGSDGRRGPDWSISRSRPRPVSVLPNLAVTVAGWSTRTSPSTLVRMVSLGLLVVAGRPV